MCSKMTIVQQREPSGRVILALTCLLVVYLGATVAGWPRRAATRRDTQQPHLPSPQQQATLDEKPGIGPRAETATSCCPSFWMTFPFAALLAGIAVLPLTSRTAIWWNSNLHKLYVAGGLSLLVLLYYLIGYRQPFLGHWPVENVAMPASAGVDWHITGTVLSNAILGEYLPFIILLFSLYTITGGIRIEGDLPAHSLANTAFLGVGAVLASFIGTTGASMLLIRPLLETNRERKHVKHTIVMFIFIVCNCGGCLLPLGDPPLFLGYLFGVPFLWTLTLWPAWLVVNGLLLVIYFIWDHFWYYPREATRDLRQDESEAQPLKFRGIWPNAFLLVGVILSVALLDPGRAVPGTDWHPMVYLREAVQLGLVTLSLWSALAVRRDNNFNYSAIVEVAVLFLGIFICMQPPLEILRVRGSELGLITPAHFFWASGSLSSVLDNAPTYAVYFETARSLGGSQTIAGVEPSLLAAVSLGSVFMGAMTYIGNGPNFMVKSIAEKSGVAMPSFFGYVAYSAAILLPILGLVAFLFL